MNRLGCDGCIEVIMTNAGIYRQIDGHIVSLEKVEWLTLKKAHNLRDQLAL
jgi:hypothetical protein